MGTGKGMRAWGASVSEAGLGAPADVFCRVGGVIGWIVMALSLVGGAVAAERTPETEVFAQRARDAYEAAKRAHRESPKDSGKAWEFGRTCFDWAEYAVSKTQRARLAQEGIAACRGAVRASPETPGPHYFLAMNLGQLARTRHLGALPLVDELEGALLRTRALEAGFNHAGADRSLGMLYRDAPGWPISVGSKKKARIHLIQAVKLDPDYPENRLVLLESAIEWDDKKLLRADFEATKAALARARKQLTGEEWEASWVDWDKRWQAIQTAAAKEFGIR